MRYNRTVADALARSSYRMSDARRLTQPSNGTATGRKPMRIHVHYDWEWCGALETRLEVRRTVLYNS
jgi:hypothetical protein